MARLQDAVVLWRSMADPYEMVDAAATWVGVDVGLKRDTTADRVVSTPPL